MQRRTVSLASTHTLLSIGILTMTNDDTTEKQFVLVSTLFSLNNTISLSYIMLVATQPIINSC